MTFMPSFWVVLRPAFRHLVRQPMGALSELRVLDLSRVLAGPWASQTLGDLGAEVIKIERIQGGDDTRAWGPPWVDDELQLDSNRSAYFAAANRNKKSVAVDFTKEEGRELILKLVEKSDIVIENFKVGGLAQYGLDYETLNAINPRLIYCSITGFGQTGPYADRPGYDFLIQGLGGLMSITGRPDNEPGGGPIKVGVALTDILTGLYGTIGILSAINHRNKTGEGQHIDMALLDVQVACLANQAMNYLTSGQEPIRLGNAHPNIVPYEDFPTRDGRIIVTVGNESQFRNFCECLGVSEWPSDVRFSTNATRITHRTELIELISQIMVRRSSSDWLRRLKECGVPCGPINGVADVFRDPQVISRKLKRECRLPGSKNKSFEFLANPIRLSKTPVEYKKPPPHLGEDTREILKNLLGLDDKALDLLVEKKVVGMQM